MILFRKIICRKREQKNNEKNVVFIHTRAQPLPTYYHQTTTIHTIKALINFNGTYIHNFQFRLSFSSIHTYKYLYISLTNKKKIYEEKEFIIAVVVAVVWWSLSREQNSSCLNINVFVRNQKSIESRQRQRLERKKINKTKNKIK